MSFSHEFKNKLIKNSLISVYEIGGVFLQKFFFFDEKSLVYKLSCKIQIKGVP